jgi:hypothetical protein
MKIKVDSRSKDFLFHKHFGNVTSFQDEYIVDRLDVIDPIQKSGNVQCAVLSVTSIASDKEGIYYDVNDLWNRVPHDNNGSDPKKVIGEAIKNGLLPQGGNLRFKPFNSYFSALGGGIDNFDSVRSALILTKYPLMIWGKIYFEWLGGILEKGINFSNYHAYSIQGWVTFNGSPYLEFDFWTGRKYYMSREVFNWYSQQYATDVVVLSTAEINARRDKTIMETIIDLCKNTIILLQALILQKKKVGNIPTLYQVAYSLLGKHLTLNSDIPKAYGCAQAMSYVLKQYGCNIPKRGISGTYSLYEWLQDNGVEIEKSEVGCILIYPTGTGNGKIPGHVFVVGKHSLMSNNSKDGLFDYQWTREEAEEYYENYGHLEPHYFRI